MGIAEREALRRQSVVSSMISSPAPAPASVAVSKRIEEDPIIHRAYYLHTSIVKKLKITAAESGDSASAIVEAALKAYLGI